jgi:3-hydroxyisobutyrate dehydrogenase
MSAERKIGFIGFGAMARPMAANLRKAGYEVAAYTPSGKGDGQTEMFPSARALAEWCDVLVPCVPNDAALRKSLYGDDGAFAGLARGALVLNTSTVSPDCAEEVAKAGDDRGLAVLDTPMSGSTPEAEAGTLVMLVGGPEEQVERARPILEAVGKAVIHTGGAASAARVKLVVNGIMGGTLAIIAEAVAYGLSSGVDRDVLFDALAQVAVISPHHQRKLKMAKAREFPSQFPTRLMAKDMGLLIDDARAVKSFAPALAVAAQSLCLATKRHADEDYSALIGAMERSVVNTP